MLETRATVLQIHDRSAFVRANQVSGCEQCNGQGCGSSKVAQLFCSQPRQFEVDNPIGAVVGDEVIVSVADGAVLRGIGLLYVLPLVLLVLGGGMASMLAEPSGQSDVYVAIGSVAGLLLGFIAAKWIAARLGRRQNQPYIARRWTEKSL
jgi:sigma-E factor negative regulatory protein RseC